MVRVSGARRWSVRMRWKALLQADCWCLGKAVEWTEAQASPPKVKITW